MSPRKTKLAANAIANNDDLLMEILIRLPIKSLIRFKSVSKHWFSLIANPEFSRRLCPDIHLVSGLIMHRRSLLINPEHEFVPLTKKPTNAPFKSLKFVNHTSGLRILQSCHGLLCCSSFRDMNFKHDYYIYNPTTKLFATLPPPGGQIVHGVNLAYDPAKSPHYKVVCVREPDSMPRDESNHLSYQIEIYSSETRSWRLSGDPFIAHVDTEFKGGVFWNGSIHWINVHDTSLYFNVDEEQLREMPMPQSLIYPDYWEDGRRFVYFGESREHLHLVEIFGPCTIKFNVYEMKSDYSDWLLKYRVDLSAIPVSFPEMIRSYFDPSDLHYYAFSILGIVREANDDESYMVLHIPGDKAIRFNLNDRTFNKIWDFDPGREDIGDICFEGSLRYHGFDAFEYIETLACV